MIKITVIYHSRKKFYNGKDIYWYEFLLDDDQNIMIDSFGAGGDSGLFLRIPETKYFEYNDTHEKALKYLKNTKIIDIIEGEEL